MYILHTAIFHNLLSTFLLSLNVVYFILDRSVFFSRLLLLCFRAVFIRFFFLFAMHLCVCVYKCIFSHHCIRLQICESLTSILNL